MQGYAILGLSSKMKKVGLLLFGLIILLSLLFLLFFPKSREMPGFKHAIPTPLSRTTSSAVSPSTTNTTTEIKLPFIALEDAGKSGQEVGCGDSLVSVTRRIPVTKTPLRAAYEQLISLHDQYYGQSGLYNSLYQSHLKIVEVTLDGQGTAHIALAGTYTFSGECDNPRFKAQLEAVARQFPTVKHTDITINNKKLDDIVSLK